MTFNRRDFFKTLAAFFVVKVAVPKTCIADSVSGMWEYCAKDADATLMTGNGLAFYDLRLPVKLIYPVNDPIFQHSILTEGQCFRGATSLKRSQGHWLVTL